MNTTKSSPPTFFKKDKKTIIKITPKTRDRLRKLKLLKNMKTYDILINELIDIYLDEYGFTIGDKQF